MMGRRGWMKHDTVQTRVVCLLSIPGLETNGLRGRVTRACGNMGARRKSKDDSGLYLVQIASIARFFEVSGGRDRVVWLLRNGPCSRVAFGDGEEAKTK